MEPTTPTSTEPVEQGPVVQTGEKPKIRTWLKVLLWAIASPFLLVFSYIIFIVIFSLVSKDDATINDSDLRLTKVEIPNEENGYFDLEKMAKVYSQSMESPMISKMIAGEKPWDNEIAKSIVATSSEPLQFFRDAANKPKYLNPKNSDPENVNAEKSLQDTQVDPLSRLRAVSRISLFDARILAKEGKQKEAFDEVIVSLNMAEKIADSQAPLVDLLVSNALKTNSLITINDLLLETGTSTFGSTDYILYAEKLNMYYNSTKGLEKGFKGEYYKLKDDMRLYDDILSGKDVSTFRISDEVKKFSKVPRFLSKFYFRKNESTNIIADYMRANIEMLNQQCAEVGYRAKPPEKLNFKTPFSENLFGKIVAWTFYSPFDNTVKKNCYVNLYLSATRTMMALKAYKMDNGALPSTLDELVPKYLPSVPVDPFAIPPAPIKYSPTDKTISSAGKDLDTRIGVDTYFKEGYKIKF